MLPGDSDNHGGNAGEAASKAAVSSKGSKKSGLAVIGTEFGCGKTVLVTGLAAMLKGNGFSVRAIKPIVTGKRKDIEAELSFISSITQTTFSESPFVLEPEVGISSANWQKIIAASQYYLELTLVELPGSAASPLSFDFHPKSRKVTAWKDCADLALQIARGVLLVAKHDLSALEKLTVHSSYLTNKGVKLLGLITVETTADGGTELERLLGRDAFELSLLARTGIPYLGCIKYSPSVSVLSVNQGNLIKLTSAGLELLEMLKALNLPIPTSF